MAAKLVERQPDPADRRSRRVVATAHGRTVLADLDARYARAGLGALAARVNDLDPVLTARGGRRHHGRLAASRFLLLSGPGDHHDADANLSIAHSAAQHGRFPLTLKV